VGVFVNHSIRRFLIGFAETIGVLFKKECFYNSYWSAIKNKSSIKRKYFLSLYDVSKIPEMEL